ncbi:hypothetical protein BRADI_1g31610v3 [Brachypodium distachyon]|uniref:Uncharacterized protein n=1 Tax=Brachypodium distachyon TaxID=15368 RepID=I1GVT3_BRADI|nr:hypothetical protein BRADI_1g31610v3 [Brachypodium distachyon]
MVLLATGSTAAPGDGDPQQAAPAAVDPQLAAPVVVQLPPAAPVERLPVGPSPTPKVPNPSSSGGIDPVGPGSGTPDRPRG